MSIFNRVVMVLGLLVLGAVLVFSMLQPLAVVQILEQATAALENAMYSNYMLYLGIISGALLLLVVLLWLELRRHKVKAVRVHQVSSGEVALSVSSIGQSLEYYVNALAGVVRVKPTITGGGKAVDVVLDVETVPDVDVPTTTDEICTVAREVVEGRLGLQLKRVRANVKQAPYPKGTRPQPLPSVSTPSYVAPEPAPVREFVPPEPVVTPYETVPSGVPSEVGASEEEDAEDLGEADAYELPSFDEEESSQK